jgi:hypothetical protein
MKKIITGVALLGVMATATWNLSLGTKSNVLSGAFLANAEALAQETLPEVTITCNSNCYGSGQ